MTEEPNIEDKRFPFEIQTRMVVLKSTLVAKPYWCDLLSSLGRVERFAGDRVSLFDEDKHFALVVIELGSRERLFRDIRLVHEVLSVGGDMAATGFIVRTQVFNQPVSVYVDGPAHDRADPIVYLAEQFALEHADSKKGEPKGVVRASVKQAFQYASPTIASRIGALLSSLDRHYVHLPRDITKALDDLHDAIDDTGSRISDS